MIKKTWGKQYFFSKGYKRGILIHNLLNMKERIEVKKNLKNSFNQSELAWQTYNIVNQGQTNLRYHAKLVI